MLIDNGKGSAGETMGQYVLGELVVHQKFGLGTVLEVESEEIITVKFVDAGRKRLNLNLASLSRPTEEMNDALQPGGKKYQKWLDETFVFEGEEAEHSLGSHWSPFFDEATDVLGSLPEILSKALVQVAYTDNHPLLRPIPIDWPIGFNLVWPLRVNGLSTVLHVTKESNQIVSVYPFDCEGTQHQLILNKVHVWKSGLEAHIECDFGPTSIVFFDNLYVANRGWYESGKTYQFLLSGIAYHCRRAEDQVLQAWNPKQSERFRELAPEWAAKLPDTDTMPVHTKGMAAFLPIEEWDRDDYSFRGPIKSVKEIEILNQKGWKVRVTVLSDIDNDGNDFNLNIVVTEKVWGDSPPPQVGEDMEGALWLQGYLWWVGAMS